MRSWLVIPASGVAAAAIAAGLGALPLAAAAVAVAAAGGAGAIRTIAGDGPAAVAAAAIGALLAAASLLELGGALVAPGLACGAAGWAFAELARAPAVGPRSAVALIPAVLAAAVEPSLVALVPIAALRMAWHRWAFVALGAAVTGVAVAAGLAHTGPLAELGARWFGNRAPIAPQLVAERLAGAVGPLTAVAALAGLAAAAVTGGRPRTAELAIAACTAASVLVELRGGAIAPVTLGLAALWAGLAIARLGALVRLRAGQAIVAAAAGALLIAPPAWSVIEHGPRIAILR